jgi:hypothetical protein
MMRITFAVAIVLASWLHATPAAACGGTFCDGGGGPTVMPVDQTGENILFVVDGDTVEAHVQIQYSGDPDAFAWIVPVMAEPEIETGSDPLFDALLAATVPTFILGNRFECDDRRNNAPSMGCAFAPEGTLADGGGAGSPDDGDPDVVDVGVAGAFEYAVLSGGTVDGVVQWLGDNGYAQDPEAAGILGEYLADGFLFVAFKLRSGTDSDEIHPVVIRYRGNEPCVPIRLTRIAAKADMGVRTFFLGRHRVVPTNYRAVLVNPMSIDWVNVGSNYEDVVTRAVDGRGSDGHGFVTEYAGSSSVVLPEGLADPRWDSSRFVDIDPALLVDELEIQGLVTCGVGPCTFAHPLIEPLLDRFLPRPAGVTAGEFYACVDCWLDAAELLAFDAPGFAAELEERIIGPGEHALDLLSSQPYLTRLYTTLSPHEMTADPLFHENEDLPDVSNTFSATRVSTCEGPDFLEFPDGRRLAIGNAGEFPDMPAAVRIEEMPPAGAPMLVTDEEEEIEDARVAWNAALGLGDEEGCNCGSTRHNVAGAAWLAFVLGFLGLARRRR